MTRIRHHTHKRTTKGYHVANPKVSTFYYRRISDNTPATIRIYSGRITRDGNGEWLDPGEYAKWHLDGRAIKHDFGDLILGSEQ